MTLRDAAKKAGFNQSAFTRWKGGAKADPEFVVKFARAFNLDVLEALVEAEFITPEEAGAGGSSVDAELRYALKIVQLHGAEMSAIVSEMHRELERVKALPADEQDDLAAKRTRSNTPPSHVEPLPYAANRRELEPEEGDDDYGPGA